MHCQSYTPYRHSLNSIFAAREMDTFDFSTLYTSKTPFHFIQHGAECLVLLLALIDGQLIVDNTILPDVDRCHATELVCDRSVVDLLKHSNTAACSVDWLELQNVSHKQNIYPSKPLISGKDLVETEVNVCQVQTGHHRHFVYDEHFELGQRRTHDYQCLFGQLPIASSSALVLNGQLQQSMDGDSTDIECC